MYCITLTSKATQLVIGTPDIFDTASYLPDIVAASACGLWDVGCATTYEYSLRVTSTSRDVSAPDFPALLSFALTFSCM